MAAVNPYLTFDSSCEAAFTFYKSVFGGEFLTIMRFKDAPSDQALPENEGKKIDVPTLGHLITHIYIYTILEAKSQAFWRSNFKLQREARGLYGFFRRFIFRGRVVCYQTLPGFLAAKMIDRHACQSWRDSSVAYK